MKPARSLPMILFVGLLALIVTTLSNWQPAVAAEELTPVEPISIENLPEPGEKHPEANNNAYWKERLDPQTYYILRESGTEYACSGAYWKTKEAGTYHCAGCGIPLYPSDTKFESGTGWPSFNKPIRADLIAEVRDTSHGMVRTEIVCAYCNGHLGHVFDDGPPPTGRRHCVNSASLRFFPDQATKDTDEK